MVWKPPLKDYIRIYVRKHSRREKIQGEKGKRKRELEKVQRSEG